ncbi:MAG: cytochrome c family protein [Deltaproteobacteria bacterium]|nr:cytochrome c family protein [Deltaproteobacteria bacterium]
MKKFITLFLVVILSFAVAALVFAASNTPPKGKITIGAGGKKPATFDHDAHLAVANKDCQVCHHKDEKGMGTRCSTCHTKAGKDGAKPAKEAFHKACGDCHKKEAKGPQYPKDCKVCHAQ